MKLMSKKNKLRFPFKYHIINFIFKKSRKKSICQDLKEWKNLYTKGKKCSFKRPPVTFIQGNIFLMNDFFLSLSLFFNVVLNQ